MFPVFQGVYRALEGAARGFFHLGPEFFLPWFHDGQVGQIDWLAHQIAAVNGYGKFGMLLRKPVHKRPKAIAPGAIYVRNVNNFCVAHIK